MSDSKTRPNAARSPGSIKAERTAYAQGAEAYMEWKNEHEAANALYEVRPDDGSPSCHVCGAIMVPAEKGFKCLSCGATTEATGPAPSAVESRHALLDQLIAAAEHEARDWQENEPPEIAEVEAGRRYWMAAWLRGRKRAADPSPASPEPQAAEWNTREFADLVIGLAKIGRMLDGPARPIMEQIKAAFPESRVTAPKLNARQWWKENHSNFWGTDGYFIDFIGALDAYHRAALAATPPKPPVQCDMCSQPIDEQVAFLNRELANFRRNAQYAAQEREVARNLFWPPANDFEQHIYEIRNGKTADYVREHVKALAEAAPPLVGPQREQFRTSVQRLGDNEWVVVLNVGDNLQKSLEFTGISHLLYSNASDDLRRLRVFLKSGFEFSEATPSAVEGQPEKERK